MENTNNYFGDYSEIFRKKKSNKQRVTFLLNRELIEELENLVEEFGDGHGYKTKIYNIVVEEGIKNVKRKLEDYNSKDLFSKKLSYYLSLNYPILIQMVDSDSPCYYGEIPELEGCRVIADTFEEVKSELEVLKKEYFQNKLSNDEEIPVPQKIYD